MSELWNKMSAEEKAPFVKAFQQCEEQEQHRTIEPAKGYQPSIDGSAHMIHRRKMVQNIERCTTVLSALSIAQMLRWKKEEPAANQTVVSAASASATLPFTLSLPSSTSSRNTSSQDLS